MRTTLAVGSLALGALLLLPLAGTAIPQTARPIVGGSTSDSTWPAGDVRPAILIETALGDIEVDLYPERAPLAVARLIDNVTRGVYDGTTFSNGVAGKAVLAGVKLPDGTLANRWMGNATPFEEAANGLTHQRGAVAFATYGSTGYVSAELLFALTDLATYDGDNVVLGQVVSGIEVVDTITSKSGGSSGTEIKRVTYVSPVVP